jgi:uncharacterized protein YutE (UPF0331/DUF86 family)
MSPLIERLAELRRHLSHLRELRPRVAGAEELRGDLSLSNDVLHSLQLVCQSVIDLAGDLSAHRGLRFETYADAVRALSASGEFPPQIIRTLTQLPGFRNVIVHEYVSLDYERVIEALDNLEPVEEFVRIVAGLLAGGSR